MVEYPGIGYYEYRNESEKMNQKIIVPLFNTKIEGFLKFAINEEEFVQLPLQFVLLSEPVQVFPKVEKKLESKPITIPIPLPRTTIYFYPWNGREEANYEISNILPLHQLPNDFDTFENLGAFAFRSGPGDVISFQTSTQMPTKRQATALLIIEFEQSYPNTLREKLFTQNPYESYLLESLLDAMRLVSGNEPHQQKGFHLNDNRIVDVVTKWPLAEFQGQHLILTVSELENLKIVFREIWWIRSNSQKSKSCRILTLALGYYYLSSTMTEFRTIFLYLIIAFEALFKRRDEDSASPACTRMAKLIAETKAQYNEHNRFLWGTDKSPGCCKIRNQIVHGESASPPKEMFWQLRHHLRCAILQISHLILSSQIDPDNYYESLNGYVNNRFATLPNR